MARTVLSSDVDLDQLAEIRPLHAVGELVAETGFRRDFHFGFACWGTLIVVHYHIGENHQVELRISSDLGVMPFSVQSSRARTNLLSILQTANIRLGKVFQVHQSGWIRLQAVIPLAGPITASALISAIILFLLPLRPYLALIHSIVVPAGQDRQDRGRLRTEFRPALPPSGGTAS